MNAKQRKQQKKAAFKFVEEALLSFAKKTDDEKAKEILEVTKEMNRLFEESIKKDSVIAEYEAALELIAAPKRPDGTYNRCREACQEVAEKVLKNNKNRY